ncbi:hypothetical protein FRB91_010865 [Serendipita sp. 411]|nr:hypothetical protein FRB91_010865 [Serendipita sp. 411]
MIRLTTPNLDSLVQRITGSDTATEQGTQTTGDVDVDANTKEAEALSWLERLLDYWISSQQDDGLWEITLEKEELDTYARAREFQLIPEDEYTPETIRISSSYRRPSVIREMQRNAKAKVEAEEQEVLELKEKRRLLRSSLSKTHAALTATTAKVVHLREKIEKQQERLEDYDQKCNDLLAKCGEITLQPASGLASEFASVNEKASQIQSITRSLGECYQHIRSLWETSHPTVKAPEEVEGDEYSRRQAWVLTRAYANLEVEMCKQEAEKIKEQLKGGASWEDIISEEVDVQLATNSLPPSDVVVKRLLESAWSKDQSLRLSEEMKLLHEIKNLLQTSLLAPLVKLYVCLVRLHVRATEVLARSEPLMTELEEAMDRLHESRFQVSSLQLDEDDKLLIRLASLLKIETDESDEISEELVLDRLKALKSA